MKDIRPHIAAKLKQMRESDEPVWIGMDNRRFQIASIDVNCEIGSPEDIHMQSGLWCLIKDKGRYRVVWVAERQGRAWVGKNPWSCRRYMSLDCILAKVVQIHPDDDLPGISNPNPSRNHP